ncbi:metabotropic glutamate receptor [Plakobranchus ocellatus]|uniref:Metabotropic glutamate receptor n=1 Tax=Plakobranchus ocellatus TaxID=259542 RepID=A0AAV4BFD6_9GAST|nr:metabotropic glutamate receptor [Plakobranchus ocellatus]
MRRNTEERIGQARKQRLKRRRDDGEGQGNITLLDNDTENNSKSTRYILILHEGVLEEKEGGRGEVTEFSSFSACPQQGDLVLSGPPSSRSIGGGAQTRIRSVLADLRADSQSTVPPMPPRHPYDPEEEEVEEKEKEEEEEEEDEKEEVKDEEQFHGLSVLF